jgi:adenine-specific DNA-methyltransferase
LVKEELGKEKLNILDACAGSGVVSRYFKTLPFCENLYANDLEYYSYCMAKCYLDTPTALQQEVITVHIHTMNQLSEKGPYTPGIITELYAPKDTENILINERCFYTHENALIIDTLRKYISDNVPQELQVYCLVPLLNKASIHTNTAGVFKGFYKNNGIGCFGGKGKNALSRILKRITLDVPVWDTENADCKAFVFNKNINELVSDLDVDVLYLDPPYNQHPYGSNYFMLNVIAKNEMPESISKVSGIPKHWNKSKYNTRSGSIQSMKDIVKNAKCKYLLMSYNNEGILTDDDFTQIFNGLTVVKIEIPYHTYKGSRNLQDRNDKVIEILYLVKLN